jgi:hypothetical protein
MGKPKFAFYEVVRVLDSVPAKELAGRIGTIMGIAEEEDGYGVGYAVNFQELLTWDVDEEYLVPMGRFMRREDSYSGESIRVDMNGNLLEGP